MKRVIIAIFITLIFLSGCSKLDYKKTCEANNGKWLSEYKECVDTSKEACEAMEGTWNECASACRHDPGAEFCVMMCVPVCSF
ncbi:hypothetical protein ACFLZN_01475 [Nanoarchaeota archaeon]